MNCKHCGSDKLIKNGRNFKRGTVYQKFKCKDCGREMYIKQDVNGKSNEITKTNVMKAGITEQELRAKYDVSFKITQVAEAMQGDVFYTEFDFIKLCSIPSGAGFRHIVDSGMFDSYRGKAGGTVYWSNPKNIEKLKHEGVLK